ncbi:MAG: pyridoxal-dependent decarboxylase [Prochlorococcaceae cyanobacterium]
MEHNCLRSLAPAPPAPRPLEPLPFADPSELDVGLQAMLEQASGLLCRWLASASERSPLPGLSVLPPLEPQVHGLASDQLLADLHLVMEGAYNPNHPGALAHLDPPPLSASVVGELICAGLNNNLLAEELSPSLSRLEHGICGWLGRSLGLGEQAGGVLASGGSLSNLIALVTARRSRSLATCVDAVVLASGEAHVSIAKALAVMGLPAEALLSLPTDAEGRLLADALEDGLDALAAAGRPVLAVVATAGTTVRGAVDPLELLGPICRRHGVWLHVDGAIGAVFGLAEAHSRRVAGLSWADSLTVNPQKVLGITKTSSLLLLPRPGELEQAFGTGMPYMEPSWGGGHGGECGLQGSRSAEVLKLWLGLRQLGLDGIAAVLDGAVGRRRRLQQLLAAEVGLQLHGGPLHLLAFRPADADAEASERWSASTRQELLQQGLMLSRPLYRGHHHLKAVLGNPHTEERHLRQLAQVVGASLASGARS